MNSPWLRLTTAPVSESTLQDYLRKLIEVLDKQYVVRLPEAELPNADNIREVMQSCGRERSSASEAQWAEAVTAVLVDLYEQGWRAAFDNGHLWGVRPASEAGRDALRTRFLARRNQQLAEPSVRHFVETMEEWRPFQGRRVSVLSLLRDGRDLCDVLASSGLHGRFIEPYIEFVSSTARCQHTGLRLQDIWRYFRHTWVNPYESIPGRSLQIVVRDASAPFHPVIGISAVSSATVRLGVRDRFIGWDTDQVLAKLEERGPAVVLNWARNVVDTAINEIFTVDFVRDRVLPADIHQWNEEHSKALLEIEAKSREIHHRLASGAEYKAVLKAEANWAEKAELPLFRAKRAAELASLIELKANLDKFADRLSTRRGSESLDKASFRRIVRVARSKTVGTEIADLTLCGAIAPYSHLAAGKLIALLSVSPPVIDEYRRRYKQASGVISSSMAGRPIQRAANLCFVGTSSLYGRRPNQYDRLSFPARLLGGREGQQVRFQHIKERGHGSESTRGIGTFQFSPAVLEAMARYVSAHRGGWRVNNVFGEGTSPKLRALRDGFENLGLDSDALLTHGIEKSLYGVALATNVSDYLLALDREVRWLFDPTQAANAVSAISDWWTKRWAVPRGVRSDIVERMRKETLVHPIRHRGRVPTIPTYSERQALLFR